MTLAQLSPEPDYIAYRIAMFDKLKAEYDAEIAGATQPFRPQGRVLSKYV